jgi:hypothetical protein
MVTKSETFRYLAPLFALPLPNVKIPLMVRELQVAGSDTPLEIVPSVDVLITTLEPATMVTASSGPGMEPSTQVEASLHRPPVGLLVFVWANELKDSRNKGNSNVKTYALAPKVLKYSVLMVKIL